MSIYFNGVCSDDLHLIVEERPPIVIARRKVEKTPIPGASRDLIQEQDAWENVTVPYKVAIDRAQPVPDLIAYERKMSEWLMARGGYQKLQDIFKPGYFRLASFVGGIDVQDLMGEAGRCTLTFDCDGRRFLDSGEEWWSTAVIGSAEAQNLEIRNPTPYTARPLIRVVGSGNIGFRLYNTTAKLDVTVMCAMGTSSKTVTLDMDKAGDATYANGTNANGIVTITSTNSSTFAKLPVIPAAGVTVLQPLRSAEESVTVSIKPRWFTV